MSSGRSGGRRRVEVEAGHGLPLHAFESHAIRFDAESAFILLKSRAYDPSDPDTYEHPVAEIIEECTCGGTG